MQCKIYPIHEGTTRTAITKEEKDEVDGICNKEIVGNSKDIDNEEESMLVRIYVKGDLISVQNIKHI